ncbi:MAG: peptidase inhibitor family I36 protein [Arachnia sp.]
MMRWSKRAKVVVVGLAAVGTLVGGAPAAKADAGPLVIEHCLSGYSCGWTNSQFAGYIYKMGAVGDFDLSGVYKNSISSAANRHDKRYTKWYTGSGQEGTIWCLAPGYQRHDLSGYAVNDNFESVQFTADSSGCTK